MSTKTSHILKKYLAESCKFVKYVRPFSRDQALKGNKKVRSKYFYFILQSLRVAPVLAGSHLNTTNSRILRTPGDTSDAITNHQRMATNFLLVNKLKLLIRHISFH